MTPSEVDDIRGHEVKAQLKRMSKRKCADEAGVVMELLAYGGDELAGALAEIFTDILQGRAAIPDSWKMSRITVLFKKGDKALPENYRPICIIPIFYKLFSKIIFKRMHGALDDAQSRDQAGFRPGFSCEDHSFTVAMLVEKSNEFGRPCWIATLDFKKAFDTITQESIWEALSEQGVAHAYILVLRRLYNGQQAAVKTDEMSRTFRIFRGTKQGDPISPVLFNSVVEKFMRVLKMKWLTKRWGVQLGWEAGSEITNLRFADDILLTARTLPQLRSMISDVAREALKVGLELHGGKTKIVHNGIGYGSRVTKTNCNGLDIDVLNCEDHVMYLGRALCLTDMHDEELRNRSAKAWGKFSIYRNELTDRDIPVKHRLKLFDAVITPTMLYSSGTWVVTIERQRRLRATQRRMLRMMLSSKRTYKDNEGTIEDYVEWVQRATREVEKTMAAHGIKDWVGQQRLRLWQWAGKVARMKDSRWTHEILHWELLGGRPQGRPRTRWLDQFLPFVEHKLERQLQEGEWMHIAADTNLWSSWQEDYVKLIG